MLSAALTVAVDALSAGFPNAPVAKSKKMSSAHITKVLQH